jgi:hypothetical protein
MSIDKTLNLVSSQKPQLIDKKTNRRTRLISRVHIQIRILEKYKNGETISREERRLPKWWWSENGTYFVAIFYTRKPIELSKGKWAVQVKDLDGVVAALRVLSKSIEDGQFDAAIETMATKVRQNFERAA